MCKFYEYFTPHSWKYFVCLTFSLPVAAVYAFASSVDHDQSACPCFLSWSALFTVHSVVLLPIKWYRPKRGRCSFKKFSRLKVIGCLFCYINVFFYYEGVLVFDKSLWLRKKNNLKIFDFVRVFRTESDWCHEIGRCLLLDKSGTGSNYSVIL